MGQWWVSGVGSYVISGNNGVEGSGIGMKVGLGEEAGRLGACILLGCLQLGLAAPSDPFYTVGCGLVFCQSAVCAVTALWTVVQIPTCQRPQCSHSPHTLHLLLCIVQVDHPYAANAAACGTHLAATCALCPGLCVPARLGCVSGLASRSVMWQRTKLLVAHKTNAN